MPHPHHSPSGSGSRGSRRMARSPASPLPASCHQEPILGPVNPPPVTGALGLLRRPFSDLGDRTGRGPLGSTALDCPADLGALVRGPQGPHGGGHHCVPSALCLQPCGRNPSPPCRQAPAPTLQSLDGGQPCRPGSPRPGLASVRGLGLAATALFTQSVQRP